MEVIKSKISGIYICSCLKNKYNLSIFFGLFIRCAFFLYFAVTGFMEIDESLMTANIQSLWKNGTDVFSQSCPLYFNGWLIGGQSPLPTYINALSYKLFGETFVAARIIQFITGCISFYIFSKIYVMLTDKENASKVILFSSVAWGPLTMTSWAYDCYWADFFTVFGLYFFLKAINKQNNKYLILSTFLFSLTFYCYIAAVFIVPPFLVSLYIYQIKKQKIKLKNAVINALFCLLIIFPYIIQMLVIFGIVKPFKLGIITFPDMGEYIRYGYVTQRSLIKRIAGIILSPGFFDGTFFILEQLTLGVTFCLYVCFFVSLIKKTKPTVINKAYYIPCLISFLCFGFASGTFLEFWRWGSIVSIMLIVLSPAIIKIFKHKYLKIIMIAVLVVFLFVPIATINHSPTYTIDKALKYAQSENKASVTFYAPLPESEEDIRNLEQRQLSAVFVYLYAVENNTDINDCKTVLEKIFYSDDDEIPINKQIKIQRNINNAKDSHLIISFSELPEDQYKTVKKFGFLNVYENV